MMITKKKYILFFLIFLLSGVINAQNVEFKKKNFKDQGDQFNKAINAIKSGEESFEKGSLAIFNTQNPGLAFQKALQHFKIAQELNPNNALNNYRIGVCYIHSTAPYEGISYLKKAHELNPECDPFLYYYYGMALQMNKKFDEALAAYTKFQQSYRKADNFSKYVSKRERECKFAKQAITDPARCWIDNVASVNTTSDEIAPTITTDGSTLIFSSNRSNEHTPNAVGNYDYDIYIAHNNVGTWGSASPLPGNVNSPQNDIVNNLFYDGTKLLLSKDENGQMDIFESKLDGAKWETPIKMPFQISSKRANDNYASYSPDGYNIYFARSTEGHSSGSDIVYSGLRSKMDPNSYGAAARAGKINSKFDDGPIYIAIDDRTMYIASKGHQSMGGYDIFVSYREKGGWSTPKNMGYPINTPYDDYFFAATANGKYAYISSNRPNGKGGFDIYKVTFWGPPKEPVLDVENFLLASIAHPMKDPQIENVVSVNKVSLTVFKGKTIDAITEKPVEANIEITDNKTGQVIQNFTTNSATGKFLLTLKAGKNYGIAVKANGYLFHSENFDIPNGSAYNMVNKVIRLKNIKIGSKIQLRNIFFDIGKSTLRSESNSELNRLVKLMKDVPALKVEISGHTDNTGSAALNNTLSQDRAQAVVDYLIGHGISKSRLTAKGYGSTQPIAPNTTSKGRQQNRRTEFKIIGN